MTIIVFAHETNNHRAIAKSFQHNSSIYISYVTLGTDYCCEKVKTREPDQLML
jgi:hypothetical protein